MKALVLAAGEGQRLRPLTADKPKPMIEVGGKPILQYNIELLAAAGIRDVIINVHHHPEAITNHFGDGDAFGVRLSYSYEPVLLGTAGAAGKVRTQLRDDDFLLVYGDNLSTIHLGRLIEVHRANDACFTMALFERKNAKSGGIADLDDRGRIRRFLEKPAEGQVFSRLVNAGYCVVAPGVLDVIPENRASDFGSDIIPALIAQGSRIFGYRMNEELWWIDSPGDYERTREEFRSRS